MPSSKQRQAARRNIKKAAKAARKKRTIAHLPQADPYSAWQTGCQNSKEEETLGSEWNHLAAETLIWTTNATIANIDVTTAKITSATKGLLDGATQLIRAPHAKSL